MHISIALFKLLGILCNVVHRIKSLLLSLKQISLDVINEISLKPIHARKLDQLVANVDREQGGAGLSLGRERYDHCFESQPSAFANIPAAGPTTATEGAAPVGPGSRLPQPLLPLPGSSFNPEAPFYVASSEAIDFRSTSTISAGGKRGGRHAPTVGPPKRRVKESSTAPLEASTESHGALPTKCPDTPSTALRKAASAVDLAADDDGISKARSNSGASIDSGSTSSVTSDLGHSSGSHSSGYSDGSESDGPMDYNIVPHRPPPSSRAHDSEAYKLPRGSSLDDMVSVSRPDSASSRYDSSNGSSSEGNDYNSTSNGRDDMGTGSRGSGLSRSRSDPMNRARSGQNNSATPYKHSRSNHADAHVGLSLDGPDAEKGSSRDRGRGAAIDIHSVASKSPHVAVSKERPGRPSPTSVTSQHLSLDDHDDEAMLVKAEETPPSRGNMDEKANHLREEALVELNKDDEEESFPVEQNTATEGRGDAEDRRFSNAVNNDVRRRSDANTSSGDQVLVPDGSIGKEKEDAASMSTDEDETAEAPDVVGGVSSVGENVTPDEEGEGDGSSPGTLSAASSLSALVPPPPPPQPYCLPPKSEWPDFPVLLRMSPDAKAQVWVNGREVRTRVYKMFKRGDAEYFGCQYQNVYALCITSCGRL